MVRQPEGPPRWLPRVVARIRRLALEGRVRFTHKAFSELAELEPAQDEGEACEILAGLRARDFVSRVPSRSTGEWLYVFKPSLGPYAFYLKVVLRTVCIVISFHTDIDE